jgi:hypothetical protein
MQVSSRLIDVGIAVCVMDIIDAWALFVCTPYYALTLTLVFNKSMFQDTLSATESGFVLPSFCVISFNNFFYFPWE